MRDDKFVEQIKTDFRRADINEQDRAMLEYAVRLTKEPWNTVEEDIQKLRDTGFEDADILDISQVAGYYAFVNRLADGLGVELEPYWEDGKIKSEKLKKNQK